MTGFLRTVDGGRILTAGGGGAVTVDGEPVTIDGEELTVGVAVTQYALLLAPRFIPPVERAAPVYSIDLCVGWVKVGEASAFEFSGIKRFLAKGQWSLKAPLSGVDCPDVDAVDSILVWDQTLPARIVYAGLVRRVPGVEGSRIREITASTNHVTWTGIDEFGVLATRKVWPDPLTEPFGWADAYDEQTGVGSTVAAHYIDVNIGPGARSDRALLGLTIVDPAVGSTSTWQARAANLDEFIARICRDSGVGCTASMPSIGRLEFRFRALQDHSGSLVLSDQGDLEALSRLVAPAAATYVIGAGQGELTSRLFRVATTGATGINRVETVYENTNITTAGGLQTATETELTLSGSDVSVDGAVSETAAQKIRFIDDYELGDWLGVEVAGVRYRTPVEGVQFTLNAQREVVRPVLGRASTNRLLSLTRDVAGLSSRLDRQIA